MRFPHLRTPGLTADHQRTPPGMRANEGDANLRDEFLLVVGVGTKTDRFRERGPVQPGLMACRVVIHGRALENSSPR